MDDSFEKSFFGKAFNPFLLAAAIFGAHLLVVLAAKFIQWAGIAEVGQRFPWLSAVAFLLFYAIFNSIFSLGSKATGKYWMRSIISFIGLAFANGFSAYLFSSLTMDEAGSFRWLFIVVSVGYLVFVSIANGIKKIVEIAQREEWNQPRSRKKQN